MTNFLLPPFITASSKYTDEYSTRRLAQQAKKGSLIRVRRGCYLPTEVWESLRPWEKYRMKIQAVHELAQYPPVFARESAAQIMGLPLVRIPQEVQTVISPNNNGGQSNYGVHRISAVAGDPPPWEMFGLLVTPPPQTVRDLAVRLPLSESLPAMDYLLQRKILPGSPINTQLTFSETSVQDSLAPLLYGVQRRRVLRVLEVANPHSESPGESVSRAFMIEYGFPLPVLQSLFTDREGLIGRTDFHWEEYRLIGEFDGYEKYSDQRFLRGRTPSEVVVAEKNRENRLRAKGYNVVRWVWRDLKDPRRLAQLLSEAGLPSTIRATTGARG